MSTSVTSGMKIPAGRVNSLSYASFPSLPSLLFDRYRSYGAEVIEGSLRTVPTFISCKLDGVTVTELNKC